MLAWVAELPFGNRVEAMIVTSGMAENKRSIRLPSLAPAFAMSMFWTQSLVPARNVSHEPFRIVFHWRLHQLEWTASSPVESGGDTIQMGRY